MKWWNENENKTKRYYERAETKNMAVYGDYDPNNLARTVSRNTGWFGLYWWKESERKKIVYKTIMNLHVRGSVIRNVQNGTTVVYLCSLW